jgi:hypothetical protein
MGVLQVEGGPPPGSPRPVAGTITIEQSDGTRVTASASSDGRFTAQIAAGTARVSGRGLGMTQDCAGPTPVQVKPGRSLTVNLTCRLH